ncbi:MAG: hypothetical protein EA398_01625 [Deltaproteobacteria bacterium]|nr:MAG: hypothetical protein EA398_01625 [Deltaproteobacteria bacterium]
MDNAAAAPPLRIVALALWGLAVVMLVVWLATGRHFVTQYQVAVEVVVEDEFGDAITTTELRDQFRPGLLPDRPWDGLGTNALLLVVLGGGLLVASRRRRAQFPPSPDPPPA